MPEVPLVRGKPRVLVVISALNEEKTIAAVIRGARKTLPSGVLVIDGGSVDSTRELAESEGATVLAQSCEGKGEALRGAFDLAVNWVLADFVIMMDGDGSMAPSEIPSLIAALESGADIAKGSRFLPGGGSKDLSLTRKIGNKMLIHLTNTLFRTNLTDLCYGFKAFRVSALKKLSPHITSAGFDIEAEIAIKAAKLGVKVVEVPTFQSRRWERNSHFKTIPNGSRILKLVIQEYASQVSHRVGLRLGLRQGDERFSVRT
jgi:glycosyltransferase involved in cell wall biosynthesis